MKCQTNFSIVAFWQLVFIMISEFLIKCVVSHIAHDIHDRNELVTHCFSQYCDSQVWIFCCLWRSISRYTSSWNFIKFCYLQWKLYTKKLRGLLIMAHHVCVYICVCVCLLVCLTTHYRGVYMYVCETDMCVCVTCIHGIMCSC